MANNNRRLRTLPIGNQAASSSYYLPHQASASYFRDHQAPAPLPSIPPPPLSPLPNQVNAGGGVNQANIGAHQAGGGVPVNNQAGGSANQANVGAHQAGGDTHQAGGGVPAKNQAGGGVPANNQAGGGVPANNQAGSSANQANVGAYQAGDGAHQAGGGVPANNQAGGGVPVNNQAGGGANQANVGADQAGGGAHQANVGVNQAGDLPTRGDLQRQVPRGYLQRQVPRGFLQGQILRGYAHNGHALHRYAPYGYVPYGHAPQYGVQYQLSYEQAFLNFYCPSQPPIQDLQLLAGCYGMHQGPPPPVQLIPDRVELPQEQDLDRQVPGHQAGGGPANDQDGRGPNHAGGVGPANNQEAGSVADDYDLAANDGQEQAMDLPLRECPPSEPGSPRSSVKRGRRRAAGRLRANYTRSRGRGRGGNVIIYM
ncbi:hypothetical protein KQX54_016603 [Cotesia glomerata]|uniref:Uncharacterized protein n=1 Tax=Cotesia glomerata TaxID=32391 RepID=A0AAV7IQ33_COTGL|nr:hypothetical protein KQX54_016603 [Cotesia glomerata]